MNNQSSSSENSQHDEALVLATAALARRRLLLKGATGGMTGLAALSPMGALATGGGAVVVCVGKDGKKGLCSISGVQSSTHTFGANIAQKNIAGKKVTYWGASANNGSSPSNAWPVSYASMVYPTFSACRSSWQTKTMFWVMNSQPTSDEAHWICAYLNALTFFPTGNFPYSPSQVLTMFNGDATSRAQALSFFVAYAELP